MPHKFHPYPVVQVVKLFVFAVLFSLLFIFLSGRFGDTEYMIITVIWLLSLILAARAFISAQFQTIILEDATITYLSGILSRNRVILPYASVFLEWARFLLTVPGDPPLQSILRTSNQMSLKKS